MDIIGVSNVCLTLGKTEILKHINVSFEEDMDPKNRPMYPAFINYLRMAKVVLEEMRKDGVFQ